MRHDRGGHRADVIVRIFAPWAAEIDRGKAVEAELQGIQTLMLAAENEARNYTARF
jgi:hypothetical protein